MRSEKPKAAAVNIANAKALKIAILVAKWHEEVTEPLSRAAHQTLISNGCTDGNIQRFEVSGSFELVYAANQIAQTDVDAVICLGCVVKGETPHFDYICSAVAQGIANLNIKYNIPFIFGVLTTNNLTQAKERAGGKEGNKGEDAALAALEMIALKNKIVIPV